MDGLLIQKMRPACEIANTFAQMKHMSERGWVPAKCLSSSRAYTHNSHIHTPIVHSCSMTPRAALDGRCSCEEICLKARRFSLCYQHSAPGSPTAWIIFSWHYNSAHTWQHSFLSTENRISVHLICSSFCFLIICKTCCVPLHPFLFTISQRKQKMKSHAAYLHMKMPRLNFPPSYFQNISNNK